MDVADPAGRANAAAAAHTRRATDTGAHDGITDPGAHDGVPDSVPEQGSDGRAGRESGTDNSAAVGDPGTGGTHRQANGGTGGPITAANPTADEQPAVCDAINWLLP